MFRFVDYAADAARFHIFDYRYYAASFDVSLFRHISSPRCIDAAAIRF